MKLLQSLRVVTVDTCAVKRTSVRRGDNAQLARVSFVDDLKEAPVAKAVAATKKPATPAKKPAAKKACQRRRLNNENL